MIKIWIATALAGLFLGTSLFAQAQPKVTKKEAEALQAIQTAADDDARIAAVENLLTKFVDTGYKAIVLEVAMDSARHKNDTDTMILYAERLLEADPKHLNALSTLARDAADHTREFDLDKEDKLKKATDLANKCLQYAPDTKRPLTVPDEKEWTQRKNFYLSDAHGALDRKSTL